MKTYIVLTIAVLFQAVGNVFLSKGMKYVAAADRLEEGNLLGSVSRAIESPTIWLGTGLLIVFFFLFTAALSWADLSFILPIISFEVILNVALADYFLNESVTGVRWVGTGLIATGVILVMRTERGKGETDRDKEGMLK